MTETTIWGGVRQGCMYLARCEVGGTPRVYEVDPMSMHVPDYNKPRAKPVPREAKAWAGNASRTSGSKRLCKPGFAALGHTREEALTRLADIMAEHRANQRQEVTNACRAAV